MTRPSLCRMRGRGRGALACVCALALCLVTLAPPRGSADSALSATTREGRLAIFEDVWKTIGERYYDPSLRGVDWPRQRERWLPLAADAQNAQEFYAILRRMIIALHDPHTRVFAPDERTEWHHSVYMSVGLTLRDIEGQPVVAEVERSSEAARAGVRAGDLLLAVEGLPVPEVLARRTSEEVAASMPATARAAALAHLFDGRAGSEITLALSGRKSNGTEKIVRLRRELRTRPPTFEVRRIGGFRVLHFNLFTQEIAVRLVRALRTGGDEARGLVIDLRDNGGGDAEAMVDLASAFLPAGTRLGEFIDRAGRVSAAPQTRRQMLFAADAVRDFRGPLVVLTSARTASAAEIFAAALQEEGRARLLGEQTCGCVLAIRRRHLLPDGGILDVSEMDYRTAQGRRLEGTGVTPDETVAPTRRDLERGRDPALARAFEDLRSMPGAGGPPWSRTP